MPEPIELLKVLSERERDVIIGLVNGLSNGEIAKQLFLAPNTVKWYIRQLNQKLSTTNRDEIVELVIRHGLLDIVPSPSEAYRHVRHNLPSQTSPFVGRDVELDEIHAILEKADVRLLTILAPGGMGKTRIAIEAAEQQKNYFVDGVYFVALQALSDESSIVPQIALATGFQFSNDNSEQKQQLLRFLANKKLLLCMDNWEHLLHGVAIVNEILLASPNVKIIATSREKLNLHIETVYILQGMAFPDLETPKDALEYDAVQFLIQTAQHVKPDWQLVEDNLKFVKAICRLTEGMPLGILLAMSWLDILSIEEIIQEIENNIDFLATTMSDIPIRQQSLRAIFQSSWQTLKPHEQNVLMKLSVFTGGFARNAAEYVTELNLELLQIFIKKSLVQVSDNGYYLIHDLLRQYLEEKLISSDLYMHTSKLHCHYYARSFVPECETDMKGRAQLRGLNLMARELANIRVAWQWASKHHDADALDQMLEGVKLFCEMRNCYMERDVFFKETAQELVHTFDKRLEPVVNRLIVRQGRFLAYKEDCRDVFSDCLNFARRKAELSEIAYCLYALADASYSRSDVLTVLSLYKESLAIYENLGDKFYLMQIYNRIASIYLFADDIENALHYGLESLNAGADLGEVIDMAWALHTVAVCHLYRGETGEAAKHFVRAEKIWRAADNKEGLATALLNIALDLLANSKMAEAHKLVDEAHALANNINNRLRIGYALAVRSQVASFEGNFEKALEYSEQAMPRVEKIPPLKVVNMLAHSMATIGVRDFEMARLSIARLMRYLKQTLPHFLPSAVLFSAFLKLEMNQAGIAASLTGLAFAAKGQAHYKQWYLVEELIETLRSKLNADFDTMWEQGKALDLESVIQQLINEFEDQSK